MSHQERIAEGGRTVHPFILVKTDGTIASFDPTIIVHVADWLRHATHVASRRLGMPTAFTEQYVCGHPEGNQRFSYVPLPSIGHSHADGLIRRALVVEHFGEREAHAAAVVAALAGAALEDDDGDSGRRTRALLRPVVAQKDSAESLGRYLSPARKWGSVTPVVLPGHDDHKPKKTAKLVIKAFEHAGYTTEVEVHVQQEPVFPGAQRPSAYTVTEAEHLLRWPRVHVIATFAEPVAGPVLIGTGRHFGLGVFASL